MSEPTAHIAARCHRDTRYCSRCDLLVGLGGLRVTAVEYDHDVGLLVVGVESPRTPMGCPSCGVIAHSHGRSDVTLVDAPCFDRPVQVVWRKRIWRCQEAACPRKAFTEQDEDIARPRALLTTRACWWAINQIRREHGSISGIARQLGTTWNTVWSSIRPLLQEMADDEDRFAGVTRLGVDEHVWHHVSEFPIAEGGRGPKQLTGMVDLTPDVDGKPRARLLDLVPGRSGKVYSDWLAERGQEFRDGVVVATLDPFHGYKNAIDDQLALEEAAFAIRAQVERALEAARTVPIDVDGVRALRRRLVGLTRALDDLDNTRAHIGTHAGQAHAALATAFVATAPDARTWLMRRQDRALADLTDPPARHAGPDTPPRRRTGR